MSDTKFWKYYLPSIEGVGGWGIFILDSTGYFSCVTDYGNYAFNWTHHGEDDFREFFAKDRDYDYLVNKLYRMGSEGELEFQPEDTVRNIKQSIIESRYHDHMDKEVAREEWDLLNEIDWTMGEIAQWDWYNKTDFCDASELFIYDYPARVRGLRDKLLPRFSKLIREELKKEKEKLKQIK